MPEGSEHVYDWFWELNARRAAGFDAVMPLSFSEIRSWILLTLKRITPYEIDWLIVMDNTYLTTIAEERAARREREKDASKSKQGR